MRKQRVEAFQLPTVDSNPPGCSNRDNIAAENSERMQEMKPKVYIETSVISYLAARPSRDVIIAGRQAETHDWWENWREQYELYISALVEQEIGRGDPEQVAARNAYIGGLTSVAISDAAVQVSKMLLRSCAVPAGSEDDALHIGIAATQSAEFLMTWNFKHINNAAKKTSIAIVVNSCGYKCPLFCAPNELGGD